MDAVKKIFKTLFTLAIILLIAGLITREALLLVGLFRVRSLLVEAKKANKSSGYLTECSSKGSERDKLGRFFYSQVRFINDQEFVLEVVCNGFESDPFQLNSDTLPALVKRQTGQSGLVWGGSNEAINLECLNRVGSVQVEPAATAIKLGPSQVAVGAGPKTECSAFGFECCDLKFQQGENEQIANVSDCPQSCYQTCEDRPLILSFTTNPYYNPMNRTVELSDGDNLEFNYVVSPNQEDSFAAMYEEDAHWVEKLLFDINALFNPELKKEAKAEVGLDFGDGKHETSTKLSGRVDHTYRCSSGKCEYTAKLFVENNKGIESYQGLHSRIDVVVR